MSNPSDKSDETRTKPSSPADTPAVLPNAAEIDRRRFLTGVCLAFGALAAALAAIPVLGFVLAPSYPRNRRAWRPVGPADEFRTGETVAVAFDNAWELPWDGVAAHRAAWLRRESEEEFIAFAVNCSHLGCPVQWEPQANLFLCPCHGGVYYSNGDVAGGPPPHALSRYPVRVRDGQVEIETGGVLGA